MENDNDIGLGRTRSAQTGTRNSTAVEAELQRIRIRRLFPDVELERFPYEKEFNAFIAEIKKLEADHDKVNGIAREYVPANRLYPLYKKTFEEHALVDSAINYRLRTTNPEEFPDDFVSMQFTTANWEPKYFINRLNKKLLMKIYLPALFIEMKTLYEATTYLENLVHTLLELDEKEKPEEF